MKQSNFKKLIVVITLALLVSTIIAVMLVSSGHAAGAQVWTDKADYTPTDRVTIYGSGFTPHAAITVTVTAPDQTYNQTWSIISDGQGNFVTTYGQPPSLVQGTYNLQATDGTNTATTTFTDAFALSSVSVGTQTPNPVAQGASATYTITVTYSGSNQADPGTLSILSGLPVGASGSFSPNPVPGNTKPTETSTLTITTTLGTTPTGTYTFTVQVVGGGPGGGTATSTGTLVVAGPSVSVSPGSWTMDVGQSKTFTANPTGGSGSYTGYHWYVGGSTQGGATSSTFTYTPSSAGSPLITVTVTDSLGATSAQSSAPSVTVNDALGSVSATPAGPLTMEAGQVQSFSASTPTGGSGTLHYQWYLGGSAVSGQTGTSYSYTADVSGSPHSVHVVVTDSASSPASVTSNTVTVTVNPAATSITVTVNHNPLNKNNPPATFVVSGDLTGGPALDNAQVTLSYNVGNGWIQFDTVYTNSQGHYTSTNKLPVSTIPTGPCYICAEFAGDSSHNGSSTITNGTNYDLNILPEYVFGALGALSACFAGFVVFKKRSNLTRFKRRA